MSGQIISTQTSWTNERGMMTGDVMAILVSKLCSGLIFQKFGTLVFGLGQLWIHVQH